MIEHVEDVEDPRLGDYRHVGDHRWLTEHGLFAAEGRLVVQRLLRLPRFHVRSVLVSSSALTWFAGALPEALPTLLAPQAIIDRITGFNFHRGCLGIVERPPASGWEQVARGRHLLALEGIGNPDNVGGLFRVAAAFGLDGVLLDEASGDPLYRKAIRTSMGAALALPFARAADLPSELRRLRADGVRVLALTPRPSATRLTSLRLPVAPPWVVLVGAEGSGLSAAALAESDLQVRIPMAATVDSLNVTVATGIMVSALRSAQMPDPLEDA